MCRCVPGFTRYCMFFYSLYHLVYFISFHFISFIRTYVRTFVRSLVFSKSQACCRYGEKYLGQVNLQPSTNFPKLDYSPIP